MRRYARELLVHLALHRSGVDLPEIMEAFWPDATIRRASERLSTEVADLRRHIRTAAGDRTVQPVVNSGGRYHLNPDIVTVDLWLFTTATQAAATRTAAADRIAALEAAAGAYIGELGTGIDSEWIDTPREHYRVAAVAAHLGLARQLVGHDPDRAAAVAQTAAALDPGSDDTTRRAIRIIADSGHRHLIEGVLDRLRRTLQTIDEHPDADTVALAVDLCRPPDATAPGGGER